MSDGGRARSLAASARELEAAASALVVSAPPSPPDLTSARELAERVSSDCASLASAAETDLAAACAACLRGLEAGEIEAGPVLMYLASATASLADALAARASGRAPDDAPLAAARYEIESFTPSESARAAASAPDVAVGDLRRRSP